MIPLLDLVAQYRTIQPEIDEAIHRVLESGQFILGSEVSTLENEVSDYLNVKYGIGVASGTDALILALRALDIGPGDDVIVPAYTFFATVGAVLSLGARPVFAEIDPVSYCIDVNDAVRRITPDTKAIIPVHLYGHPADMDTILDMAAGHGIKVIEDNAQAFGAVYHGGKTSSLGDIGCLSFFPSKNLGGYGDGGMVVTQNEQYADRIRMLRTHGWKKKYYPELLGYNSRLDAIQAAILRVKLSHVDEWNNARRMIAQRYVSLLGQLGIELPCVLPGCTHVFHQFIIRVSERDRVRQVMKDAGINTDIYYPQPPYLAKPCEKLGYNQGDFPIADKASQETLALPIYPELALHQQEAVATALHAAIK